MTVLDDIINGATDDAVSTSNLLRKVQVVAHRLGATEITAWVRSELNGYKEISSLPLYRGPLNSPVMGTWAGYGGRSATFALGEGRIPEDAADALFTSYLNESIAQLEQLAETEGKDEPAVAWDPMQIVVYNQWVAEGLVAGMSMMNLISAKRLITRGAIRGVIGSARNTALEFALELQATSPDAGSQNGPTVQDAPVASTIFTVTNNIYGHGANVATGGESTQTSTVTTGDLGALLAAAKQLGLADSEAEQELATVAIAAPDERDGKMKAFLAKVQNGLYTVATTVPTTVIVDQLERLLHDYFGS